MKFEVQALAKKAAQRYYGNVVKGGEQQTDGARDCFR